jgi:hypothetical protein
VPILDWMVSALTHHVGHELTDDVPLVLADRDRDLTDRTRFSSW